MDEVTLNLFHIKPPFYTNNSQTNILVYIKLNYYYLRLLSRTISKSFSKCHATLI